MSLLQIKQLAVSSLLFFPLSVAAQTDPYCGEHKFDDSHKNEVQAYATIGNNIMPGAYGGLAASYTRHIDPRFSVVAFCGEQFNKQITSISGEARYRLPIGRANLWGTARYLYSRYQSALLNEHSWNIGLTWEARYWDLRLGCSQTTFYSFGSHYCEPLAMQVGLSVNIKPREAKWNLGLFFRNYEETYYENWNINWGLHWNARVCKPVRLFGELCIRPAGSMSQLASKYEFNLKMGAKYVF